MMDMRGRKRSASTASLDMMESEQSSFPFMQLPLELRQRVYDFYLLDFNERLNKELDGGRTLAYPVAKNVCYRPIAACEILLPTARSSSVDNDAAFLAIFGRREVIVSGTPKPALLSTELMSEVLPYFLRTKLVFDLPSILDIKRHMAYKALDYSIIIKYYITAQCLFPTLTSPSIVGSRQEVHSKFATKQSAMIVQLMNDGQAIEVRWKWKLNEWGCRVWSWSLRKVTEKSRAIGQRQFTGEDILQVADSVSRSMSQLTFCELSHENLSFDGNKRYPVYKDIQDVLLSKEWVYDHLVCSASLS